MFKACQTAEEVSTAYFDLTLDRGFAPAKVLVPLIQTAANQAVIWKDEAVHVSAMEAEAGKVTLGTLRADPVGWMPVMNQLRGMKVPGATTTVLTHAFPGKSATEATLAWLNLLDQAAPDAAEREAQNLYFAWTRDADRTAVNQQVIDTVGSLLARSSEPIHRYLAEWLPREAATWPETKTDDREIRPGLDSSSGRIPPLT